MSENDKKESKNTEKTTDISGKIEKNSTSTTPQNLKYSPQKDGAVIEKQASLNGEFDAFSVQNQAQSPHANVCVWGGGRPKLPP